jgi:xyloglucan-specific exo-beta-1,4-glucanase
MRFLLRTLLLSCSVASAAVAGPYTWHNVRIVAGGFIPGIVFSPKQAGLAYVRTDIGGFYRWDAQAKKWIPLTDWVGPDHGNYLGGESIAPDPVDANKVYCAAGMYSPQPAAIMRSSDQGRTWAVTPVPIKMGGNEDGRGCGERLNIDPNDTRILYFGSRYDGLWKSTDSAVSWQKVDSFPMKKTNGVPGNWRRAGFGISFIIFDPRSGSAGSGSKTLYAGIGEKGWAPLYRSTDAGVTWQTIPGEPEGLVAHQAGLDSDGYLYVTLSNSAGPNGSTDGAVWKFDTATEKWSAISPVKPDAVHHFGYAGLSIDRQHVGTFVVTTANRWNPGDDVFRTTDGGKSWMAVGPTQKRDPSLTPYLYWGDPQPKEGWWMDAVAIDPFDSDHVMYGTGATIWGSHDLTALDRHQSTHWSVEADGIEETAAIDLISPPAGPMLISGLGDVCGFVHDDVNVEPQMMMNNPIYSTTRSLDFAQSKPAMIVRVGDKAGAISMDAGKSWAPFSSQPADAQAGAIAISADGGSIVWAAEDGDVGVSKDGGKSWRAVKNFPAGGRPISDRVNPVVFYALGGGRLTSSSDGGATFGVVSEMDLPRGAQLHATSAAQGDLWINADDAGLFHSTDGGAHFQKISSVAGARHLGFGKAAAGRENPALYLAGTVGGVTAIFRSDDAGQNWQRLTDDQHQFGWLPDAITGDARTYGRVYLGTNGRGVIYGDPDGGG